MSSSSSGTSRNIIGAILDTMKRAREEKSKSASQNKAAAEEPRAPPKKAATSTPSFLVLEEVITGRSQPLPYSRPEKWPLKDEDPGVVRVMAPIKSQSQLGLGVACTAFGMASTWYFLGRATRSRQPTARYSIENDTKEIESIIQMTRDIYSVCKRDTVGFALAEEDISSAAFPKLANKEWMARYKDLPIATLPLMTIILPVIYRIDRTRRYIIQLNDENRVFFKQDNIDEPELSADQIKKTATDYLLNLVADNTEAAAKKAVAPTGTAKPTLPTATKSTSVVAGSSPKAVELQKRLTPYLTITDDIYERQRPHLAAIRAGSDLQALENAMAFFTGNSRDDLLDLYYNPLINALKSIESLDDDAKKEEKKKEVEKKEVEKAPAVTLTSTEKIVALAQSLLESDAEPNTRVLILAEPPSIPLESSRRPSLHTMPSIVEVAAQILYSPYLINPATGVQYPFSIVISIGDSATMSIFKDGYEGSPWLLFDSHGSATMTLKLFNTIESLGQYDIFRAPSFQVYEVYLHKADRDAIVTAFTRRYADAFGGLEPFKPPDAAEKVDFGDG